MKSIYEEWGFRQNPFETTALPSSEVGASLLVGRSDVLKRVCQRIVNAPKITTIEGQNGVGKTSIANVASFCLYQKTIRNKQERIFVPCRDVFQLIPGEPAPIFRRKALLSIAQTLIERASELPPARGHVGHGRRKPLDAWLNSAQLKSFSANILSVSAALSSETNTSDGFGESGFEKAVVEWLQEIFPNTSSGGVVCVIDNLELLRTSKVAKQTVEELRDILLGIAGVRWVMCGALGIVHGIASSPRLEGYLHKPIEVVDFSLAFAMDLFKARTEAFQVSNRAFLPIDGQNFQELCEIYRGNLRSVLSACDDFCSYVADAFGTGERNLKPAIFFDWLDDLSKASYFAIRSDVRPRSITFFMHACNKGSFSPSDFLEFGFETMSSFKSFISELEEEGLLTSAREEAGIRRKTIQVTAKGWLVRYYRDRRAMHA